jgi:hypothetical protein
MTMRAIETALALSFYLLSMHSAPAITADLAKKCREMALAAHPTQPPGSKIGSASAQLEYYRNCVAKKGNVER